MFITWVGGLNWKRKIYQSKQGTQQLTAAKVLNSLNKSVGMS